MYYVYSLLVTLVLLSLTPFRLLGVRRIRRYRVGWRERLGRYPEPLLTRLEGIHPVWLHAVSVGEVGAASILAAFWTARRPKLSLLISTVTATGREVAKQSLPQATGVVYFPVDLPMVVHRALTSVKPRLVLLTETEMWPNFLRACSVSKIPVAMINGRISARSFRRYRVFRPFFRRVLQCIDLFCMQSVTDAERILALGASPERVHVVGNLKFDATPGRDASSLREQWQKELKIEARRPVVVAGSTYAGEEEVLLRAFMELRQEFPDILFVLAPRHPDRLAAVEDAIAREGLAAVRRTALAGTQDGPGGIVLLDTLGELSTLYAIGSVAFVGGSLVPEGGHNLLEPALYGCPVLFGPYMENFADASESFLERGAAVQVKNGEDLAKQLARLLRDPVARDRMGRAGLEALEAYRGACERTVTLLERFL